MDNASSASDIPFPEPGESHRDRHEDETENEDRLENKDEANDLNKNQ